MEEESLQESSVLESLEKPSTVCTISTKLFDNKFEVFADFECGVPQKPQHLFFDFTPTNTELDTPEVREKVAEFWHFLWAQEDIERYCVIPERGFENLSEADLPTPTPDLTTPLSQTGCSDRFQTAVDVLTEIDVAQSYELSKENSETHKRSEGHVEWSKTPKYTIGSTYKIGTSNTKHESKENQKKKDEVRAMCEELDAWDKEHPKSMDPPARIAQHKVILQKALKPYTDINLREYEDNDKNKCECGAKSNIEEEIDNITNGSNGRVSSSQ